MTNSGDSRDKLDRIHRHWGEAVSAASKLVAYDQLGLVLDYWASLWASGGPPLRGAIDPTRIGPALAYIYIMDYDRDARALRYRLIGEHVRAAYTKPVKEKLLSDVVGPGAYQAVAAYFLACPELPAITMLTGRLYQERSMPAFGQRLLLPLFDERGRGAALLGLTLCEHYYDSLSEARLEAERRISIFPLDGSEPTTTVS